MVFRSLKGVWFQSARITQAFVGCYSRYFNIIPPCSSSATTRQRTATGPGTHCLPISSPTHGSSWNLQQKPESHSVTRKPIQKFNIENDGLIRHTQRPLGNARDEQAFGRGFTCSFGFCVSSGIVDFLCGSKFGLDDSRTGQLRRWADLVWLPASRLVVRLAFVLVMRFATLYRSVSQTAANTR